MTNHYGFYLDVNLCLGCGACIKACSNKNNLPSSVKYRRIKQIEMNNLDQGQISRFFLSTACNHCGNPECMGVCPSGAYAKRRDGIVIHLAEKCTACKSCVASCPFGAPQFNPITGKAAKCQMCYERLDRGERPHCVEACITGALQLRNLEEFPMKKLVPLTVSLPTIRLTRPSTYYAPPRASSIRN